jgi:peptidoglycan hydrolase CwlO-like protein
VTHAETTFAVGAGRNALRQSRRGFVVGALLAALLLTLLTGPAVADQSGTQAQADQLAAQIARLATHIHDLTTQFQSANAQASSATSQLADARNQLGVVQRQVDAGRAVLRREAVNAYVADASHSVQRAVGTSKGAINLLLRREYLSMATGDLNDTLDQLRVRVQVLQADQATIDQAQQTAHRAVAQAAQARQAALAAAGKLDATLAQVKGQLAREVADAAARAASRHRVQLMAARHPSAQGLPVHGVSGSVNGSTSPGGGRDVWYELRMCESSDNYAENSGNGYYGAYQFDPNTWTGLGYPGRPDLEPPAMQDEAAQRLQAMYGWGQWPACSAALGLS